MVESQHPLSVRQQLAEQAQRLAPLAGLPGPGSDVAAGCERLGIVAPQHPLLVGQQLPEQTQRLARIACLAGPMRDAARVISASGWSRPSTRS